MPKVILSGADFGWQEVEIQENTTSIAVSLDVEGSQFLQYRVDGTRANFTWLADGNEDEKITIPSQS